MRRTAFRRMFNERPVTWLLRDEFSDTRAAGSVNGTMPTPGPGGARTVTDTENKTTISGGNLLFSGGKAAPGYGDPAMDFGSFSRVVGRLAVWSVSFAVTNQFCRFGFGDTVGIATGDGVLFLNGSGQISFRLSPFPVIGAYASGTSYKFFELMRAAGYYHLMATGNGYPLLIYVTAGDSGSQRLIISNHSQQSTFDFVRVPADLWLPTPLVSDGFGSTFGTTDGLGYAEGVTGGIGSGGGNVAWTQQVGTWTVSSGKSAAATLSGGVAVATVPLSTADVFAKVKVTRSAGSGGMVLRWTDANNHLYTEHDGTNAYLKQVLSGSTTTLITAAATYSAGAEIVVDLNGTAGRLYYNNALVGTTSSVNSGLTATAHGLRSTDTSGIQLDDFVVYAKGTGGEYSLLNRYVNL